VVADNGLSAKCAYKHLHAIDASIYCPGISLHWHILSHDGYARSRLRRELSAFCLADHESTTNEACSVANNVSGEREQENHDVD
jgi:hypothetical protein